jgi:hypothetical protein
MQFDERNRDTFQNWYSTMELKVIGLLRHLVISACKVAVRGWAGGESRESKDT